MNETKNEPKRSNLEKVVDHSIEISICSWKLFYTGLKTGYLKYRENLVLMLSFMCLAVVLIYKKYHLKLVTAVPFDSWHKPLARFFDSFGPYWVGSFAVLSLFILFSMIAGLRNYKLHLKYQRALDLLSLKAGLGEKPRVTRVDAMDEFRTRILVRSAGIGEEKYRTRLDDLRSAVGQRIESVTYWEKDNRFVEISLATKVLDSFVKYADLKDAANKPYSFVVGKSLGGIVTESLENVPHYVIAGSTGGGKSVAFKNMLLGLLESTKNIQVYIFDFKKVEANEFTALPNVSVIKDEQDAALVLEKLVKEMDHRYEMLEGINAKKLDPLRDKMDRIVIAIDETTDLLGKVPRSDSRYALMLQARSYLNELARKARASGIHLIFATQKVDATSIDTQIQENLEGRLSFRMNTIENSVRVLQNNMSYYLPSIPGRAIWKKGANYTEVQCPFISDEELVNRLGELKKKKHYSVNKMIDLSEARKKSEKKMTNFNKDNSN